MFKGRGIDGSERDVRCRVKTMNGKILGKE